MVTTKPYNVQANKAMKPWLESPYYRRAGKFIRKMSRKDITPVEAYRQFRDLTSELVRLKTQISTTEIPETFKLSVEKIEKDVDKFAADLRNLVDLLLVDDGKITQDEWNLYYDKAAGVVQGLKQTSADVLLKGKQIAAATESAGFRFDRIVCC